MKLIYSFFLIKKNQKIKTAPARAKTPVQRLNGNELATLRQISVLIAFVQGFLNARSDDVNPFRGSPPASPVLSGMRFAVPFSSSFLSFLPSFLVFFFSSFLLLAVGIAFPCWEGRGAFA